MNKNEKDLSEYLQTLSEYFILISDEQNSPKIIWKLNEKLNEILHQIHEKLELEEFQKSDCQYFADRIDEIILLSAKLTQKGEAKECEHLSEIKQKLWYLLENLEYYCIETYDITIW
jgi:predicted house-cleaning noncanonical NTP pyrophosphatase (MazG superfamily)